MRKLLFIISLLAMGLTTSAQEKKDSTLRGEREKAFITELGKDWNEAVDERSIVDDELEPYGKELYILPGDTYRNKNISNSIYLKKDSTLSLVWDKAYPKESIANLFIVKSEEYHNTPIKLKMIMHEYGEQEDVTTTAGRLIAAARNEGCEPYFGVEKEDSTNLQASLFLCNKDKGYVHVINISCKPDEVIGGKGKVNARASLYVPTNNIQNLIAPYKKKSPKERIKYDKK